MSHAPDSNRTERSFPSPAFIWCGGVIVPAFLVFYGLACIFAGAALIFGTNGLILLRGGNATIAGIGSIAFGGVLHCTCFWDSLYGSTRTCARRKLLCLTIVGFCAYALCLRLMYTHVL
jgi:hypothetical protein